MIWLSAFLLSRDNNRLLTIVVCCCQGMLVIFAHWFCFLRLLKLLTSIRSFWAETIGFSKYTIILSANRQFDFLSSYLNMLFIFLLPDFPGQNISTVLNRVVRRRHPHLVLVFKGNASSFCPFNIILPVSLSQIALFWDMFHQYLDYCQFLTWRDVEFY